MVNCRIAGSRGRMAVLPCIAVGLEVGLVMSLGRRVGLGLPIPALPRETIPMGGLGPWQ